MKKVLFVESRRLCYGSSYYLIDRLSRFFKQKKIEVEFFDYDALCNDPQKLETFSKKSFDAIFDINSQLPGIYQDDTLFLEHLDIPFFQDFRSSITFAPVFTGSLSKRMRDLSG